jgi:hypothetical protein
MLNDPIGRQIPITVARNGVLVDVLATPAELVTEPAGSLTLQAKVRRSGKMFNLAHRAGSRRRPRPHVVNLPAAGLAGPACLAPAASIEHPWRGEPWPN